VSAAHGGHPAKAVGFRFEGVILHDGNAGAEGVGYPSGALLHHVGEFVAEQDLAMRGVRVVLAWGEVQVGAPCECDGSDSRSLRADVDAHI
jgi:hypothetical protein